MRGFSTNHWGREIQLAFIKAHSLCRQYGHRLSPRRRIPPTPYHRYRTETHSPQWNPACCFVCMWRLPSVGVQAIIFGAVLVMRYCTAAAMGLPSYSQIELPFPRVCSIAWFGIYGCCFTVFGVDIRPGTWGSIS